MVGANAGVVGMTKEHLGLALALSVPVFVVVTKIDMCPQNVLQVFIFFHHYIQTSNLSIFIKLRCQYRRY